MKWISLAEIFVTLPEMGGDVGPGMEIKKKYLKLFLKLTCSHLKLMVGIWNITFSFKMVTSQGSC